MQHGSNGYCHPLAADPTASGHKQYDHHDGGRKQQRVPIDAIRSEVGREHEGSEWLINQIREQRSQRQKPDVNLGIPEHIAKQGQHTPDMPKQHLDNEKTKAVNTAWGVILGCFRLLGRRQH